MTIHIVGHRSPDTDSICAAIAYSELKKAQGIDAVPNRLGPLSSESTFVLKKWEVESPALLEDAAGKKIIIVDHSEMKQGPKNLDKAEILEIVDHHRIGDVQTSQPILFISKPVGCSCTVIYDLYKDHAIEPSKKVKALILSAILSDTWIFKSKTCTQQDKDIAEQLAKELNIDLQKYGMEMLESKIDFADKNAEQIMKNDVKQYDFAKGSAYINVYELIAGVDKLLARKQEFLDEMKKMHSEHATVIFAIIDMTKNETHLFSVSKFQSEIEQAYKTKFTDNQTLMPELFSRKKQIVPILEKIMN
jgi:manganese-dependent inorganic pyrophosphatase